MNVPPPERGNGLGRTQIMLLTMVAEVVGVIVIAFALPFAWSTRLVVIAAYVLITNTASRMYLRRSERAQP
jgi:multisubunit Na+/H+ antiporter MnhG subunit